MLAAVVAGGPPLRPLEAEPIWAGADGTRYALFRREVTLPSLIREARVLVTAAQSGPAEKLLGAYRLFVAGEAIGIGPGRGDARTAAYPDGGDNNHTAWDEFDVTALTQQAANGTLVLGLQCYHESGDSSAGVLLELRLGLSKGSTFRLGTSSSDGLWLSFDATAAFGPTGTTGGAYSAPQEWARSGLMPSGWTRAGWAPSPAWLPPATRNGTARSLEPSVLRPKPTRPLSLTTGVPPASLRQLNATGWFADFGHAMMGGLTLTLPAAAFPAGTAVQVTLGEELVGDPHKSRTAGGNGRPSLSEDSFTSASLGNVKAQAAPTRPSAPPPQPASSPTLSPLFRPPGTTILYPMRTGNRYRNTWLVSAPPPGGAAAATVFEHHEYMLFRYATLHVAEHPGGAAMAGGAGGQVEVEGGAGGAPFGLAAWRVHYPWRDEDSHFASSNATLDAVWRLAADTLRYTSLDTATDSNTRERLPYEADGYITGLSRLALQAEVAWPRHSWRHNLLNPTWPTEWRQTTPLMALADYLATGELALFDEFEEALSIQTQRACLNATTRLIDFRRCTRQTAGLGAGSEAKLRDIVDWPQASRDHYVLTDAANTVVNAFAVGGLRALATLRRARGDKDGAAAAVATAQGIAGAVNTLLWDDATGLYRDGLENNGAPTQHSAWHASVFAAAFGLVPTSRWPRLLAWLRARGMVGSVYAAFYFLQALYQAPDHGQTALETLASCAKNSWCAMLRKGATATMEAWQLVETGPAPPCLTTAAPHLKAWGSTTYRGAASASAWERTVTTGARLPR